MSMSLLRIALGVNGVMMFAFGFVLFFNHRDMWVKVEGRKVAGMKTKFDTMIWRIVGLWVGFVGLSCLFVADVPGGWWSGTWGFEPASLQVLWSPLAGLVATTHAIETWVKYEALGPREVDGRPRLREPEKFPMAGLPGRRAPRGAASGVDSIVRSRLLRDFSLFHPRRIRGCLKDTVVPGFR
ncbi:hypothetical protein AK812_SmicGene4134 [Symbiodinium microadriaticum]|uniref:Uncharacterized protein n=1 Tax=Symbiodinium microadriaticum TaxID=2951 RepID=A0A1Q9EX11_SYMMI|nr:hypothetical protein AK812_SmicGene4134 [Symbiodinium microadriaticum]